MNVILVLQVDELRQRVRELEERERKESKKLADEDALRKLRVAEETIEHLQKKLTATKQVCLVLLYFIRIGHKGIGHNVNIQYHFLMISVVLKAFIMHMLLCSGRGSLAK